MENQQPLVLPIPDAISWAYQAIVLGITTDKGNDQKGETSQGEILKTSLVLDSGSSINIMINAKLLDDICAAEQATKIHCGGKLWKEKRMGHLHPSLHHLPLNKRNYFYYCPNGVVNLMSLSLLTDEFDIMMNLRINNAFYVFDKNGNYMRYGRCPSRLYRVDIEEPTEPFSLLSTVEENKNNFSAIDVKRAELARDIQNRLCLPSDYDLATALEDGTIQECGVTCRSVRIKNAI